MSDENRGGFSESNSGKMIKPRRITMTGIGVIQDNTKLPRDIFIVCWHKQL